LVDIRESFGPQKVNNKKHLILKCLDESCGFYYRVASINDSQFGVTAWKPHECSPLTHLKFKARHSMWYMIPHHLPDVAADRKIKITTMLNRERTWWSIPEVRYRQMHRVKEVCKEILDGKEEDSFALFPDYLKHLQEADPETYVHLKLNEGDGSLNEAEHKGQFQACFIALGACRHAISQLRQFFAIDGTYTRSKFRMILLILVGIDANNHVIPLA
jgi:hypothetical protein